MPLETLIERVTAQRVAEQPGLRHAPLPRKEAAVQQLRGVNGAG